MFETKLFNFEYIPAKRMSKKLLIVFHGRGDSPKPFLQFNSELKLYDFNYLILRAPKKYLDGYSWYGEPPYQKDGVIRIRQKLLKLLQELVDQGWQYRDIFLLGFSQGCLVSSDLALHSPQPLGGLIGVSGYFQFFPRWRQNLATKSAATPWLITHGTKDDVLRLEDTKYGVDKLRQVGIKIDWIELNKDHEFLDSEYPLIRKWIRSRLQTARS